MSNIEWTGITWNPVVGCSMVSPGCAHCYAETMSKRLAGMARADVAAGKDPGRKGHYLNVLNAKGRWNGVVEQVPEALTDPLTRKKPTTWFVNSMSDLFHEGVPFDYVDRVFAVMAICPQHVFQILTKRPERMAEYLGRPEAWAPVALACGMLTATAAPNVMHRMLTAWNARRDNWWPLSNVHLGTSIENQATADERSGYLRKVPAAVRWYSIEPLLEAVTVPLEGISWVVTGGESGPGARPCNVEWIRSIVRQCQAAGVPVFTKQIGSQPYTDNVETANAWPIPLMIDGDWKPIKLKDPKGGTMEEWPEDLRVRQMPGATVPA